MGSRGIRIAVISFVIVVVAALAVGLWLNNEFVSPGPLKKSRMLVIAKGAGVEGVARLLAAEGVISSVTVFRLGLRFRGQDRHLRAGEYEYKTQISMADAADMMVAGRTVKRRLTVAEGLTTAEVFVLVRAAKGLSGRLPRKLSAEGSLLPETYFYSYGDRRKDLVARMQKSMKETIAKLWPDRAEGLVIKTRAEAMVLASIIEKETAVATERPRVAAVFHNRLKRGMRLQSDPTVGYALTQGIGPMGRPLTRIDLLVRSPYNTYAVEGLPPGPIANPGRLSIRAALHPAATDDLYFVADGKGGHAFAHTLADHNRNVTRWRKLRRKQRAR